MEGDWINTIYLVFFDFVTIYFLTESIKPRAHINNAIRLSAYTVKQSPHGSSSSSEAVIWKQRTFSREVPLVADGGKPTFPRRHQRLCYTQWSGSDKAPRFCAQKLLEAVNTGENTSSFVISFGMK